MLNINYPYDDSPDTVIDLISRCQCYDYASFNASQFINTLTIFHLNIRSVTNKIDQLCVWLSKLVSKPTVIFLSETWSHDTSPTLILPGYNIVNVPRMKGIGGGVCVCIDSSIRFEVIPISCTYMTFECAAVSIDSTERAHNMYSFCIDHPHQICKTLLLNFHLYLTTSGKSTLMPRGL